MSEKFGMNPKTKRALRKLLTVLKFGILLTIIVGVPLLIYIENPDIIKHMRSLEAINEFLDRYQTVSMFVYIGIQIIQIIIAFLPGHALQLAAGYAFCPDVIAGHPVENLLYILIAIGLSLAGIALGTIATFYLGKLLGKDMILLIFGETRMQKFINVLNSKKGIIVIALLYLFPGIPKDVFTYAAGISEVRMLPFLLISLAARTPALICSIMIGNMLRSESYTGMIIVAAIVLIIVVLAIVFRRKFVHIIDKLFQVKL